MPFELDWTTVAAVIVALAAIGGLLVQFFKRDKPWRKGQQDLKERASLLESRVENIATRVEELKGKIEDHDRRDEKDFERIEGKIEKLTDLMIKMLSGEKE